MPPVTAPQTIELPFTDEFDHIYRNFAPVIFRTAWGVLGNREDAEDVLQTIFVKLLRREYPPDLARNPKAYLCRAAVTVSLDILKARRRRPVLVDEADLHNLPEKPSNCRFEEEAYE